MMKVRWLEFEDKFCDEKIFATCRVRLEEKLEQNDTQNVLAL